MPKRLITQCSGVLNVWACRHHPWSTNSLILVQQLIKCRKVQLDKVNPLWCNIGDNGENGCVSQQEMEDMQKQVDTLQSQLNDWHNVTINILRDLYFTSNSGMMYTSLYQCI